MKQLKIDFFAALLINGLFFLIACGSTNPLTAERSLKGIWKVTEVISNEVEGESTKEPGTGTFNFGAAILDYSFSRKGQSYQGKENWRLEATKENAGFVKVDRFNLYTTHQNYKIEFGNQTQNAERNATKMSLVSMQKLGNGGAAYRILLRKQ